MSERVGKPFTDEEIEKVQTSIQKLLPGDVSTSSLPKVLREVAHISHKKDWTVTQANARALASALWPQHPKWEPAQQQLLQRILRDGNWKGAQKQRSSLQADKEESKPWAVLVTVRVVRM